LYTRSKKVKSTQININIISILTLYVYQSELQIATKQERKKTSATQSSYTLAGRYRGSIVSYLQSFPIL